MSLPTEITLSSILNEIIASKIELKNSIISSEERLKTEIQALQSKVKLLEEENREQKLKIERLEKNLNKNNIIIFGIDKPNSEITTHFLTAQIKELLEVNLAESDIGDYYRLGKSDNSPVKIELISHLKKKEILLNAKKLKGTHIAIANDLTKTQREEIKALKNYMLQLKSKTKENIYIRGSKLIIGTEEYSQERLEEEFGGKLDGASVIPFGNGENRQYTGGRDIRNTKPEQNMQLRKRLGQRN